MSRISDAINESRQTNSTVILCAADDAQYQAWSDELILECDDSSEDMRAVAMRDGVAGCRYWSNGYGWQIELRLPRQSQGLR